MLSIVKPQSSFRMGYVALLSLLAIAALSLPAFAQRVAVTNLTSDITNAASVMDPDL